MTNTPRFFAAALLALSCAKETPSEPEVVPSNAEAASSSSERATQASHAATSSSDASAGTADIETQTARDGSVTSAESRGETAGGHAETSDGAAPTSVTQDASAADGGTEPASDAAIGKPFKRPQLVVSGVDNYWSEQDLVEVTGVKASITINEAATRQKWLGFSGGLNEAGWEALGVLSETERAKAVELLFGESGLHLGLAQLPIGAGESALGRYFHSEVEGDYAMEHFTIERDELNLIPYVEAARAANPELGFWAVPWSPPPWMKTNLASDGGSIRNEPEVLQAYALYLAKFIEAYGAKGIAIDALHLQTEPDLEARYPSCLWKVGDLQDFTKGYLLPTLDERGLPLQVWAGDFIQSQSEIWVRQFVEDPELTPRLAGIGAAWGMRAMLPDVAEHYSGAIFQTQHEHGNAPYRPNPDLEMPPNDHAYGVETWALLKEWLQYSSAYNVVNLALDSRGWNLDPVRPWPQNALLVVDRETKTLRVTPAYYVFRHLSQFLDRGASRLEMESHDALAFKNPNDSIVVALHNEQTTSAVTTLDVRGSVYELTIPAAGWVTVFVE